MATENIQVYLQTFSTGIDKKKERTNKMDVETEKKRFDFKMVYSVL